MGKTGNYFLVDGFCAFILIPFRNFFNQYVSFTALGKGEKKGKRLSVFIGILLAIVLIAVLIPLLKRADSGGFAIILNFFANIFAINVIELVFYSVFSIPVAAYIYGLASGVAHKKGTAIIKPESAEKTVASMRFIQPTTIFIALGAVCGIYLVFILSQTPYFFSAFTGRRPEGWLVYSEYARRGFFELCTIAAINLAVITLGNVMSRKQRMESRLLKAFNIALSLITLVLIATAFSKMALYIGAYGLTMPRLLPCVFMVILAAVFVALIALQKFKFSIVRFALVTGAVLMCVFCLINPDAIVVRYNTDRYLSGTLPHYDMEILYRASSAGVFPALEVYETTQDESLKNEIVWYLEYQLAGSDYGNEVNMLSIESYRARERMVSSGFFSDTPEAVTTTLAPR